MGALTCASATSLARLIAGREVTAREAVEAHLRRIEAVDVRMRRTGRARRRRRPVALGDPGDVELRGMRVAVQTDNGLAAPTAETVAAVATAAEALAAAGATVEESRHPDGGHELTIEVWRSHGEGVAAADLWRLLRRWDGFLSSMLAFAARYDLLVCPVFASPARLHGTMNVPGEIDPTSRTPPHSLTGWPAATVRAGISPKGLPIDVQLVARPWRDDVALAAALRIERELGEWPPPSL